MNDGGVCRTAPATPGLLNIGPMIRIGREIQCLPYAGFFLRPLIGQKKNVLNSTKKKIGDPPGGGVNFCCQLNPKKIIIIGPMIRIGREIQCLPYAGFFIFIYFFFSFFFFSMTWDT